MKILNNMIQADAFAMPLKDRSVDMIITSPPFFYGFASYMQDTYGNRCASVDLSRPFGLEVSEVNYKIKAARALVEMERVCHGPILIHTNRIDLWDNDWRTSLAPWFYPESDTMAYWMGWHTEDRVEWSGWVEEPKYRDGHWGVFSNDMVWDLMKHYVGWNAHRKVLDPFAGTNVVSNVAGLSGGLGIGLDINGS